MILVWILSTEERKYIYLSSKPLVTVPDFLLEPLNQLTLRLNPNSRIQVTGNLEFSDLRGTRRVQSRWTKADSRVSESDLRETMERLVLTAQESCGWCRWEKGWMGSAKKSIGSYDHYQEEGRPPWVHLSGWKDITNIQMKYWWPT